MIVFISIGIIVVGFNVLGTVVGLCVAVLLDVLGFKYVEDPCGILAPD